MLSVHLPPCLQEPAREQLTLEQAQSPACQPLVADMCLLLRRLLELSHLEDKEQRVSAGLPQGGRGMALEAEQTPAGSVDVP